LILTAEPKHKTKMKMKILGLCYCGGIQLGFSILLLVRILPKIKLHCSKMNVMTLYAFLIRFAIDVFVITECENHSIIKWWISIFTIVVSALYEIYRMDMDME